jgi:hypothetical protein
MAARPSERMFLARDLCRQEMNKMIGIIEEMVNGVPPQWRKVALPLIALRAIDALAHPMTAPPATPLLRFPRLGELDQPDLVMFGFHGTRADIARKILDEQHMIPSDHEYEWLGRGVYFWEDDPVRALQWAKDNFPGVEVSVIQARIRRGVCLNELTEAHRAIVKKAEELLLKEVAREGRSVSTNPLSSSRPSRLRSMTHRAMRANVAAANLVARILRTSCCPKRLARTRVRS